MKNGLRSALVAAVLLLSAGAAMPQELPSTVPALKLNTVMHTAPIRAAAADGEGRLLATASLDKTVRLWSLATGELLRVLRPPIGGGAEGRIYALAMSPDGRFVVAGGFTGYQWEKKNSLYVFEAGTGRLVHRVGGLPEIVNRLAWSPDGRLVAAALAGANGVRVFKAEDWQEAGRDDDYADQAYGLAFDRSGRLAAAALDGYVRLYDRDLKRIAKVKATGGPQPSTVAFSPDGTRLAVAYFGAPKVEVLSVPQLQRVATPDVSGLSGGSLSQVAWTADGGLIAGGQYFVAGTGSPIVHWADGQHGKRSLVAAADGTVTGLVPLADGGFVYAAADPAFGRYDARLERRLDRRSDIADFRNQFDHFRVAADGSQVAFGLEKGGARPVRFDLAARRLIPGAPPPQLRPAETAGLPLKNWQESNAPTLAGRPLRLEKNETAHSIAVAPDRRSFLLGTSSYLRRFGSDGEELWATPVLGEAWAVDVTHDGRLAVAALADGTIRWYRYEDGQPLLALFPHRDGRRWVLWTPEGFYDTSLGGEDLIGWHLNRGLDNEADFFPASRFRDRFYRPEVMQAVLRGLDVQQALAQADAGANKSRGLTTEALPPVIRILSPSEGQKVGQSPLEIRYSVRSPSGQPVTAVEVKVDGRPAVEQDVKQAGAAPAAPDAEREGSVQVPISQDATITLVARAGPRGERVSDAARVAVAWQGAAAPAKPKPNLYALAIGINQYQDEELRLLLASKDAGDVASALEAQKGRFYQDVKLKVIRDAEATRIKVIKGLEWIDQNTGPNDIALVYWAGHGDNLNEGTYYFLPADVDQTELRATAVPDDEVLRTLRRVKGKIVFFLDTCHAGGVMGPDKEAVRGKTDITGLVNEWGSAENGVVVFAAATSGEEVPESPQLGNGAYAKALVEALTGRADGLHPGQALTVDELEKWLTREVPKLTGDKQHPDWIKPEKTGDFPIAAVQ